MKLTSLAILRVFRKTVTCGQTVLPDGSILIGQKLVENAQIQKLKCDILSNLQTMCKTENAYWAIGVSLIFFSTTPTGLGHSWRKAVPIKACVILYMKATNVRPYFPVFFQKCLTLLWITTFILITIAFSSPRSR